MHRTLLILFFGVSCGLSRAQAFKESSFGVGLGYYSQNFLNKVAQSETGEAKLLGEANYPLNLKYDVEISSEWFFSPQLSYTFSPRKTPGSTATVTLTHLAFFFGKNMGSPSSKWDWYFGPGALQEDIKGKGGTEQLPNGTSTATFALPGRTSSIKKLTMNAGSSFTWNRARFGLDLILENAFSSTKRTQSLMLSYSYLMGGGSY